MSDLCGYGGSSRSSQGRDRLMEMPARTLRLDRPIDLVLTLGPHRRGLADPTIRLDPRHVVRATRTADGPATIELRLVADRLEATAWGPGAELALDSVPAL